MGVRTWRHLLAAALTCAMMVPAAPVDAAQGRGRGHAGKSTPSHAFSRPKDASKDSKPPRAPRAYQEPAFESGFDAGFDKGIADGREGERYDPVRHREYRDGDRGYSDSYGTLDGYKNNYRAGFRQGYEQGYREGTRSGRK